MKRWLSLITAVLLAGSQLYCHDNYFPDKNNNIICSAASSMISENGIALIKEFEGFVQYAQWDYKQWSIGYGTGVDKDAYPNGITEAEADRLLREVVVVYEGYVQNFLNKYNLKVTQNQYDALVSFTYNMGNVWTNTSEVTIRTYLVNGISNYTSEQIREAFKMWCKAGGEVLPGLVRRREREADLFLSDFDHTIDLKGERWRVTSATGVRFRTDSITSAEILGVIPYNTIIIAEEKVERDGFLWGKVKINDIYGWCVLDYAEHISGSVDTNIVNDNESYERWKISSETGVNLRYNHSTNDEVLTVIPFNTEITVYEKIQKDNFLWARTEYKGKAGWCVLDYAEQTWPVPEDPITEIYISSLPVKVVYEAGELFDSTGMKVAAKYKSGREEEITEYGCNGNTMLPGISTITVDFQGFTCDLSVLVNPSPGDVNQNGIIDTEDSYNLKKYILCSPNGDFDAYSGDINGDGVFNVIDIIIAKNEILYREYR